MKADLLDDLFKSIVEAGTIISEIRQQESEGVVVEIERSNWPDQNTVEFCNFYTPEEIGFKEGERKVKFRLTRIEDDTE